MSEKNKALARLFYEEVFNKGSVAAIDELVAPGFVIHTPMPGMGQGIEDLKQMLAMFISAFPDLQVTVDEVVAEGDSVAVRHTMQGTHQGDLMGIPPTGKHFSNRGIDLIHISRGKATAVWHFEEEISFYEQLGIALPLPKRRDSTWAGTTR